MALKNEGDFWGIRGFQMSRFREYRNSQSVIFSDTLYVVSNICCVYVCVCEYICIPLYYQEKNQGRECLRVTWGDSFQVKRKSYASPGWASIIIWGCVCRYSSVYCIQCHGASERVYITVNTLRCVCTVYTWYITKARLLQTKWESHYATKLPYWPANPTFADTLFTQSHNL